MAKAIFFNIPASGHVNPSLPLVAELVRRGEQIIYYLTENFRKKIEAAGAEVRPYSNFDDTYMERNKLDGTNPPRTAALVIDTCRDMLPELIEAVRTEKPDYIIYDSMCPWGALIARILKLPSVTSVSLLMFQGTAMFKAVGARKMLPMMIKGLPNIMRFHRSSNAIGQQYHVKPLSFGEFYNAPGDLLISFTAQSIQPDADKLKMNIHFVGPSIAPRNDSDDFPLEQLNGTQVIYISLGTLVNDHPEFFRNCIAAFADTPYTVVMSIGSKVKPEMLGTIPAHFIVRPFNPQLEILQRSALFITHAGMNSVHEGLYYNVPLLLFPQQEEQTFVAQRIQDLGAGLRLTANTPEAIRQAAERILNNPSFRQQASALGKSLRDAGGVTRAADHILAMVGKM